MKLGNTLRYTLTTAALVSLAAITIPNTALAGKHKYARGKGKICKLGEKCGKGCRGKSPWYVSANIGVSHLFDDKIPGSTNSVNQNGPGWNVNAGYQFNHRYGLELGFNNYHDSRETTGSTEIARTEHYAAYLAGTGRYRFSHRIHALGKLGLAYSYANKVLKGAGGAAKGANSLSLYYGAGIAYHLTKHTEAIAQWSRALGNDTTGSADLYTVGFSFDVM